MWLHTHMQMQSHARSKLVVEQTFGYIVVSVNIARKMYKLHQRPLPEHEQKLETHELCRWIWWTLLCSTPCPAHPSDLSQTRITLTWSLDSCMNVLFAPVRANFPAQYIVSRKACWAIARVHFQPLLPSKIAPWHYWPVHMAKASQFAGVPMQQFMEVSVQDLVAAPSTSLYMNMCVTHW